MPVKKNLNLLRKQIDFLDSEFIIVLHVQDRDFFSYPVSEIMEKK